jgi:hypothetical protein
MLPPPLQLGITFTACFCITAAHCRQSTNFSNGPRNLSHTVHFATRTQKNSSTTINNIFVDIIRLSSSSTVKYKSTHRNKNGWITQGIKISCEHKRRLYTYIDSRDCNYAVIKAFCVKYCKILNKVTQEAKNSIK